MMHSQLPADWRQDGLDERLFISLAGADGSPHGAAPGTSERPRSLIVSDLAGDPGRSGPARRLSPGGTTAAGIGMEFAGVAPEPAVDAAGLPGFAGGALVVLAPAGAERSTLIIGGEGGRRLELTAGASNDVGVLTYPFDGQRDIAGITVRRDRGTRLVWIAVALLMAGLAVTFYVPRRRLWTKLRPRRCSSPAGGAVSSEASPAKSSG